MKTKDFIKMLQEEDPSGECYIRLNGDPIWFAEQKEGYWDGPYNFIEKGEDGKYTWTASTKGHKVDIHTMDMFSFSERYGGDWEEVKKHIKVEYTYLDNGDRERQFMEHAKEECDQYKEMRESLYEKGHNDMKENAKKGWRWFQNKDVDKNEKPNLHKYYTWKIYDEKKKERMSSVYNTESIMKSGDWEKVDNKKKKGYYEWIFKN